MAYRGVRFKVENVTQKKKKTVVWKQVGAFHNKVHSSDPLMKVSVQIPALFAQLIKRFKTLVQARSSYLHFEHNHQTSTLMTPIYVIQDIFVQNYK